MTLPPTAAEDKAQAEIAWRRPLLFALPVAALAFFIGMVLNAPSGQGNAYDQATYPLAFTLLVCLSLALWILPKRINSVVTLLVFAMSCLFISKLIFILFFETQSYQIQLEMTETFFWIPALQVLSFFIPNLRAARTISITFFVLFFVTSLAYLTKSIYVETPLGIIYSLLELNLANLVLFTVTNTFMGFKEKYVRSISEHDTTRQLVITDLLTGLPNRQRLNEVITEAMAARRAFALLFIDLDGFKLINDTLGHITGDYALQEIARRLAVRHGPAYFAARLSGDEFVVVLFTDSSEALRVAKALLSELAVPITADGQIVLLSASIGMSLYPEDGTDVQQLIRHADTAMYTVKTLGKHGVRRYEQATDSAIERLKLIEQALTHALAADQFHLVYQPIWSLSSGELQKLEALLRWTHPNLGAVSAAEFIPIAEKNGQIISIGTWALKAACAQARQWIDLTGRAVTISVNVSPLQFMQTDFVAMVRKALSDAQLPASALELELTESTVMRRPDIVKTSLHDLQQLGVKIAIDDFGTGYSSLAYLRDLPINCIKIDQSFIHDLGTARRAPQFALALIEAVIGIAETLELQVVAEGVETEKQLEMLQNLGCHLAQGYFLAPPLEVQAALEMMTATLPLTTLRLPTTLH